MHGGEWIPGLPDSAILLCGCDIVEDRSEVVERFAKHLVARQGHDQAAAIFAYADAVLVFHFENFLVR